MLATELQLPKPPIPDSLRHKLDRLVHDNNKWHKEFMALLTPCLLSQEGHRYWINELRRVYTLCECQALSSLMQASLLYDRYNRKTAQVPGQPVDNTVLAACFLISTKQYEIYAPLCSILCNHFYQDFTKRHLEKVEIDIIFALDWKLIDVLPLHFTELYFELMDGCERHFTRTSLLIKHSDYAKENVHYCVLFMLTSAEFQRYSPVVQGAAAILMATRFEVDFESRYLEAEARIMHLLGAHITSGAISMDDIYQCRQLMVYLGIEDDPAQDNLSSTLTSSTTCSEAESDDYI